MEGYGSNPFTEVIEEQKKYNKFPEVMSRINWQPLYLTREGL